MIRCLSQLRWPVHVHFGDALSATLAKHGGGAMKARREGGGHSSKGEGSAGEQDGASVQTVAARRMRNGTQEFACADGRRSSSDN